MYHFIALPQFSCMKWKKFQKVEKQKEKDSVKVQILPIFLWYQSCLSKVYESRFQKWKLIFDVLQEDDASAGIFSTHIWV